MKFLTQSLALIITQDHSYSQARTTPELLKWNFSYHWSHKSPMIVSSVITLESELAVSLCSGTLHSFTKNASLKRLKNFFLKLILEHSIHLLSRGMVFRLGWWMVLDTFILLHAWKFFQMFLAIIWIIPTLFLSFHVYRNSCPTCMCTQL